MTLTEVVAESTAQTRRLKRRKNTQLFLRRYAEMVAGTGLAHKPIISGVLAVHGTWVLMVARDLNILNATSCMDMSDPEQRRSLKGHLPDDSKLWPQDETTTMQHKLFVEFDHTFSQPNSCGTASSFSRATSTPGSCHQSRSLTWHLLRFPTWDGLNTPSVPQALLSSGLGRK